MHDYFQELDLNPPAANGGPISNPLDKRAMHYFGFLSNGQEVAFGQPTTNPRVAVSWHYGNQPTPPPGPPQPPPPIDAILDFAAGPPLLRYEVNHDRSHVIVWIDLTGPNPPPPGQPVMVRVRAWAKE